MATRDIEFSTLGGAQSFALYEATSADAPVVLIAPALGIRASYYAALCEQLADRGIAACAVDLPGLGESPVRASRSNDWGYPEMVDHYRAACDAVSEAHPGNELFVLGHSLGGQIALMLAGTDVPGLRGVVLVASGTPWWRAWEGLDALKIRLSTGLCSIIASVLGYFPGRQLGFGGREAKTMIHQWATLARTGEYRFDGFSGEKLFAKPGPPTLAFCLEDDDWAPERAMKHALDKLVARDVQFETWGDPPHDGDHNRWPSEPEYVVERVCDFVERQSGTQPDSEAGTESGAARPECTAAERAARETEDRK